MLKCYCTICSIEKKHLLLIKAMLNWRCVQCGGQIGDLLHLFRFGQPSNIPILNTDSVLSNFEFIVKLARFLPWSTVFLGSLSSTTSVRGWFVAQRDAVLFHDSLQRLNDCPVLFCRSCWNCCIGVVCGPSACILTHVPFGVRVLNITW